MSQLLYFWADSLVLLGYKKTLILSDLWDLDSNMSSSGLLPKFDAALNPLIKKSKILKKKLSILPALVTTFGTSFLTGAVMQIIIGG